MNSFRDSLLTFAYDLNGISLRLSDNVFGPNEWVLKQTLSGVITIKIVAKIRCL